MAANKEEEEETHLLHAELENLARAHMALNDINNNDNTTPLLSTPTLDLELSPSIQQSLLTAHTISHNAQDKKAQVAFATVPDTFAAAGYDHLFRLMLPLGSVPKVEDVLGVPSRTLASVQAVRSTDDDDDEGVEKDEVVTFVLVTDAMREKIQVWWTEESGGSEVEGPLFVKLARTGRQVRAF